MKVCIIKGKRIPFMRSSTRYMGIPLHQLMQPAMNALTEELNLNGRQVGEVVVGAVNKHAYDFALAREVVMGSNLCPSTPATDIQKACGTSLEATIMIANKIALGQIDCGIAGGIDTNSDVPIEFQKKFSDRLLKLAAARSLPQKIKALRGFSPRELIPKLPAIKEPRTGKSMGESCEDMAKKWQISRESQDQLALQSQLNAAKAYQENWYQDLVVEYQGQTKDGTVRETSLEKLSRLKPAFDKTSGQGTLTAGNSSPLTDGASCVFLCSEKYAQDNNLEVMAYLTFAQSAAVNYLNNEEGLLMAPAYAVPKLLQQAGLSLQDFDFYEIHEAFAAQVLCTLEAWKSPEFCQQKCHLPQALGEIDRSKLNVKGGSLAIGHPFAATGTRIITSLAKLLHEKGSGRGLISICTAGGMGVTAILEK